MYGVAVVPAKAAGQAVSGPINGRAQGQLRELPLSHSTDDVISDICDTSQSPRMSVVQHLTAMSSRNHVLTACPVSLRHCKG